MSILAPEDPLRRTQEEVADQTADLLRAQLRNLAQHGALAIPFAEVSNFVSEFVARMPSTNPWAEIIGPSYTSGSLQEALGIERGAVSKAVKELRLLRLETPERVNLYPAFQIREGRMAPHLRPVLEALRLGVNDPWTWAQWLNTQRRDADGQPLPRNIDRLFAGDASTVLAKARQDAATWAA